MNYYILTSANPQNNPAMIKAAQTIIDNGHKLCDKPEDADVVIISDDIKAQVSIIMNYTERWDYSKPKSYTNWNNFLAREFV